MDDAQHGDADDDGVEAATDNPLASMSAEEQLAMIGGTQSTSPGGRARRKSVFCNAAPFRD
jgi:hypothetical protein